jgi:hypothetical protein
MGTKQKEKQLSKPFIPEDLLEVGDYEVVSCENDILIVDNWYKNYDDLYDVLTALPAQRWKWSKEGKNFVDYYDCRPVINLHFPDENKIDNFLGEIGNLITTYLHQGQQQQMEVVGSLLEFNFYKNIKENVSNNMQHYPHIDFAYNYIVYLDKVSSGGTALYHGMNALPPGESDDLLFDVSAYDRTVVHAKPNRMVVFPGITPHGGYIEDHNAYIDDWRMNQVFFLKPTEINAENG